MDHPVLSSLAAMATTASSHAITATSTRHSSMTPFPTTTPSYPPLTTTVPGVFDNGSDGENTGECKLLGPFSLLVQAALGALALVSLVYKRWKERPQRPLKIWAFDASKQVFGSAMLHLANLLMSMFSAGQLEMTSKYQPNPCSFYLLNLGIDVSISALLASRKLPSSFINCPISRPLSVSPFSSSSSAFSTALPCTLRSRILPSR